MPKAVKISDPINLVESHKPKNFKYRYIIKDPMLYSELEEKNYDISNLDTIDDDALVDDALKSDFVEYDREVVAHAKEPTEIQPGIIVSKKMVTKADKKLWSVGIGFFEHNSRRYMAIKLQYERFDIIECFLLT